MFGFPLFVLRSHLLAEATYPHSYPTALLLLLGNSFTRQFGGNSNEEIKRNNSNRWPPTEFYFGVVFDLFSFFYSYATKRIESVSKLRSCAFQTCIRFFFFYLLYNQLHANVDRDPKGGEHTYSPAAVTRTNIPENKYEDYQFNGRSYRENIFFFWVLLSVPLPVN